jgi:chromosome segregation ATPase
MKHKEIILQLQQQIEALEEQRYTASQKLGLLIRESDPFEELIQGLSEEIQESLRASVTADQEFNFEIQELSDRLTELRQSLEADKQIGKNLKEIADSLKEIREQEESMYAELGQRALEVFTEGPERFQQYKELFADALQAQERFYELSSQVEKKELAARGKNSIQNVIQRGLALADQVKRNGAERKLKSEYKELGAAILQTDFHEQTNSQSLKAILKPFSSNNKKREEYQAAREELESKRRLIQAFLNDLKSKYNTSTPERLISQIEQEISQLQEKSSATLNNIGMEYYGSLPEKSKNKSKATTPIEEYVKEITTIGNRISTDKHEIDKHKNAITAEELKKRISQLQAEEEKLARQITERQDQLDQTSQLLTQAEEDFKASAKLAGDALKTNTPKTED